MALHLPDHDSHGPAAADPPVSHRYAWLVFILTFGLMLSDYMSRQVINAVFPALKAEWALSDTQLGMLVSVVALTVGVMSFPISLLADRWGRVKSATAMALLWGVATVACGLSGNFLMLFIARALVGLGEAGYGSAGGAILLSVFPQRLHATVAGAFLSAALFGSVLGVLFGGLIAESYGWRTAFILIGAGGLLIAVIYPLIVREPASAGGPAKARMPLKAVFRELLRSKTARWTYLGSGLQMFVQGSIVAWLPSYLNRYHAMDLGQAAMGAAVLVLMAGIGMTCGGVLVDRLSRDNALNKLRVPMCYALGSSLVLLLALNLPAGSVQLALLGLGLLLGAGFAGPSGAVVSSVTDASIRASVLATLTLANNIFGLAPGPFITGLLADSFNLQLALTLVPLAGLGSAVAFFAASRHYQGDLQRQVELKG